MVADWGAPAGPVGLRQRLSRITALARHHRPGQFAGRALAMARRQLLRARRGGRMVQWPGPLPKLREDAGLHHAVSRKLSRNPTERAVVAERFRHGRVRLLNREIDLGQPVDWRRLARPDFPRLWRFQFHYHEFLLDAVADALAASDCEQLDTVWLFVLSWIDANFVSNPRTHDDAWHPFCISRRLPVWIALWITRPPPEQQQSRILGSIVQQARFLDHHLERDLGGNHLLENLHALAMTGAFLDGAEPTAWIRRVVQALPKQLREQLLEHGEHFERSPMYHALMLDAVLDMHDALARIAPDVANDCRGAAVRMADFLECILHPDGEIPLLSDAAFGGARPSAILIAAKRGPCDAPAADAGSLQIGPYWIWRDQQLQMLLFDAGLVGADHLPAHAHCDLLNIEASVGGRRLVVDTGVFGYEDDPMRQYCRSTAAHNVLQIDGLNQCDVWSRFRMGHRGHPTPLETGEHGEFSWARAAHNAYRRCGVPRVGRWIGCRTGGLWMIVDWACGTGAHRLTNRLHLHPQASVVETERNCVRIDLEQVTCHVAALGEGRLSIKRGWYCPEFGLCLSAPVLEWEAQAQLPAACGWCFRSQPHEQLPALRIDANSAIHVSLPAEHAECVFNFAT